MVQKTGGKNLKSSPPQMEKRQFTDCLSKDELISFIEGNPGELKTRIEDHLLECSLCYDAVISLSAEGAENNLIYDIESLNQDIKLKYNAGYKRKKLSYYYYASSAAVIFIMLFSYLFFFNQSSSERLFGEYYKPYPNIIPMVRGEGIDFELKAAMVLYNSGNYKDAVAEFDKILVFEKNNEIAAFYKGISFISTGEYKKVIPVLKKIQANPNSIFMDQSYWYEALTYLAMEQNDKAVSVLEKIVEKNNYYSQRAASLLKEIFADG